MRYFSDKRCTENENTHFILNIIFSENLAVYEIMWKNMVQEDRPQMTIKYGACALQAGQLRLQTLIVFTRQKWLRKCASISRDASLTVSPYESADLMQFPNSYVATIYNPRFMLLYAINL